MSFVYFTSSPLHFTLFFLPGEPSNYKGGGTNARGTVCWIMQRPNASFYFGALFPLPQGYYIKKVPVCFWDSKRKKKGWFYLFRQNSQLYAINYEQSYFKLTLGMCVELVSLGQSFYLSYHPPYFRSTKINVGLHVLSFRTQFQEWLRKWVTLPHKI